MMVSRQARAARRWRPPWRVPQ